MSEQELEADRQQLLEKAKSNFDGEDDLKKRFGPNTFGSHELLDRAFMLQENWEHYVKEHPTTLLNPDAFKLASEIVEKMYDFYNLAARKSLDE